MPPNNVQGPSGPSIRVLEPGLTAFSAAEVHVAVIPVGDIEPRVLESYYALITKHKQVELQSIQPFYTVQQKSPFKFFPWKQGCMHFRFLPEEKALAPSPLTALHTSRNVLGVIGICHCPTNTSLGAAYERFETVARQFPGAMTLRCFAFQPTAEQVAQENKDKEKKANLMMFPPTAGDGLDQLENHASFLMLDFAAALLGELETRMLTASPVMVDLQTFADTSDKFLGPSSLLGDMQRRFPATADEEVLRKKRYGRLQKMMGDFSLLAGSPSDAADHYTTAVELARISNDSIWCAAALIGMANAKVLEQCLDSGAMKGADRGDNGEAAPLNPSKRLATLRAASQVSVTSTGLGGQHFWDLLRESNLEHVARGFYTEARSVLPRRGGAILQIEADVQLARLVAGLHGTRARHEVSERASAIMDAGLQLLQDQDKLTAMMEAAQILGLVGSARKRTLILCQAVEFSRNNNMAATNTLQIARKALEPPDDPQEASEEPELMAKVKPLGPGVPQHWSSVRCACIEGVLSTAILAQRHADVWDAAALLLREHWRDLPKIRQETLMQTLEAAASRMKPEQLRRQGAGPPPLITFHRAVPPPPHLQPRVVSDPANATRGSGEKVNTPFIYNPSEAKRRQRSRDDASQAAAQWICGEVATVEVEVWNPTCQEFELDRVTLDAEHVGDPSVAPRDQSASASWKPYAFGMSIPPNAPPSKVQLTGIPQQKGLYNVTGCTITLNKVSWHQRWSVPPPPMAAAYRPKPVAGEAGGTPEARVTVAEPLPLLRGRIEAPPTCVSTSDSTPQSRGDGQREDDAPEPTHLTALKGQILCWQLRLQNAGEATPPAKSEEQRGNASPQPTMLTALKGQVLSWEMEMENTGRLSVAAASLTAEQQSGKADPHGRGGERLMELRTPQADGMPAAAKSPALTLHLSQPRLQEHLPLRGGSMLRLPLMLHCPEVASYNQEEDAVLDFRIEYHGGRGSPSVPEEGEAPPAPDPIGRCYVLPAQIRYLPSLQISSLAFFEHHMEPQGGDPRPTSAMRRCILELDVLNRAPVALQVWLGPRVAPGLESREWQAVVERPRPWQQGGAPHPNAPSSLACKIVSAHTAGSVAGYADGEGNPKNVQPAVLTEGRGKAVVQSREHLVAARLVAGLAIYWRREDLHDKAVPVEMGCLPLPQQLVEKALTVPALDLLDPSPLQVSFVASSSIQSASSGAMHPEEEEPLTVPGEELEDGQTRQGGVWGYRVGVGVPLHLSMQVSNGRESSIQLQTSITCHSADLARDVGAGGEDPNAMLCGSVTDVTLSLEAGATGVHAFAVCFLLPGLYQVYSYDAQMSGGESETSVAASGAPLCSVRTCYILVA